MPQPFEDIKFRWTSALPLAVAVVLLCAGTASAVGEWSLGAGTNKDWAKSVTVEDSTHSVSNGYDIAISYSTDIAPNLALSNDFTFDVSEDHPDEGAHTKTSSLSFSSDLSGEWFSAAGSWDESMNESTDPLVPSERDWSYSFDVALEPEYPTLPNFTYSFSGDKDTINRSYSSALEYSFLEKLNIAVDASKDISDPRPGDESDDDSRTLSGSADISFEPTSSMTLDFDWSGDRAQSLTLTSGGLLLEKSDTLDNSANGNYSYTPFEWFQVDLSKSASWAKDLMTPDVKATRDDSFTTELSAEFTLTSTASLSLSHSDDRSKSASPEDVSRTWSQSISSSLELVPLENFSLNISYDRSYDRDRPTDPLEEATKSRSDSYDYSADVSVFDGQINYSVSRSESQAWDQGVETSNDASWDHSVDIAIDKVPNLSVSPSYSRSRTADYFEGSKSNTRSMAADFSYDIALGSITTISLTHSYSRDADYPTGEANTVSRSDSTSVSVELGDFLNGMSTSFNLDRSADDQSGDDVGPVVDFTHGFSFDWSILGGYDLNYAYDHSLPQEGEHSESHSAGLSFSLYDDRISCSFSFDRSITLKAPKNEESSYTIEVSGEL